ncbi:MAG: ABC transporter ATP-binding protein [Pseudomonadales bacterium]|nr:ABC transporter ATP-binding protein [Pseudomonadales bacterium]
MQLDLPYYKTQSDSVKARFEQLKQREVMLELKDIGKTFSSHNGTVEALKGIQLSAYRREFLCIVGPSGCGKSTLIRILAGLETPTTGQVLLSGQVKTEPGPDRGMVFQGYTLFPWLSVCENVMFGLRMQGQSKRSARAEAMQWVEMVGLAKFANSYPHQLSGGMQQRVAIARALASQPQLLLMDEPFAALDAQTRAKMQSNLLEIWKNIDISIVFITHDLDEAIFLADRILVLKAHPGETQELIEVAVPRPRQHSQYLSPEFLALKQHLEQLIHPPNAQDDDGVSMIKLTAKGDDIEVLE